MYYMKEKYKIKKNRDNFSDELKSTIQLGIFNDIDAISIVYFRETNLFDL